MKNTFEQKRARLAAMKNIGEKSAGWMIEVGVDSPAALGRIGAVETYCRMKSAYPRHISLCALWALQGALLDIPYTKIPKELKDQLKRDLQLKTALSS
jgi:DNA transformation protein and related proteins